MAMSYALQSMDLDVTPWLTRGTNVNEYVAVESSTFVEIKQTMASNNRINECDTQGKEKHEKNILVTNNALISMVSDVVFHLARRT